MADTKPIPSRGVETQRLIDYLRPLPEGRVASYEELSTLIGRDVQNEGRHNLRSAQNWLLRNRNVLWAPVPGLGIKRCNDAEKVDAGRADLIGIRRKAKRATAKIESVDNYDNLPADKQTERNTAVAQLGAVALFSSNKAAKRIEAKMQQTQKKLTVNKTLELFSDRQQESEA